MVTEYFSSIKGFDSGHLARYAFGHTAAEQYATSVKTSVNFMLLKWGSLKKRSGSIYMSDAHFGQNQRLHASGRYILVSGEETAAIIYNGTYIRSDEKVNLKDLYTASNGYKENDIILDKGLEQHVSSNLSGSYRPNKPVGADQQKINLLTLNSTYDKLAAGTYDKILKTDPIIGLSFNTTDQMIGFVDKNGTHYIRTYTLEALKDENKLFGHTDYGTECWGSHSNRTNPYNIYAFDEITEYQKDHKIAVTDTAIKPQTDPLFDRAIKNVLNGTGAAGYYQNRLVIAAGNKVFFSAQNSIENFDNSGTATAATPFVINITTNSADSINVLAHFQKALIVGTNEGIYVVASATNATDVISANLGKDAHQIASIGVANVQPIYYKANMYLISSDRSSFIVVKGYASDSTGRTLQASEAPCISDYPYQLGGIIKMEMVYWRTPYVLCLTTSGSMLLCTLDAAIRPSEIYFGTDAKINDFAILKRNGQPDTVWLLIERHGRVSVEWIYPPIMEKQYTHFFKDTITIFNTIRAREIYRMEYRALIHDVNNYCDYAYRGRFDTETAVFEYDHSTGIVACSEAVFFKEMEYLAILFVDKVIYEIIEVIDDNHVKVRNHASPDQQSFISNWIRKSKGLFFGSKIIPKLRRFDGYRYIVIGRSLKAVTKSLHQTHDPAHIESSDIIDLFATDSKGQPIHQIVNGFLTLNYYVETFTIGLPYRTMVTFTPSVANNMPNKKYSKSMIKVMTSFSGAFYSGKDDEDMNVDNGETQIRTTDLGLSAFHYKLSNDDRDITMISDDATNLHILNYSEVVSV